MLYGNSSEFNRYEPTSKIKSLGSSEHNNSTQSLNFNSSFYGDKKDTPTSENVYGLV
jgi:hypothetical protein